MCARHWKGPSRNFFAAAWPVERADRLRELDGVPVERLRGGREALRAGDAEVRGVHRERGVLAEHACRACCGGRMRSSGRRGSRPRRVTGVHAGAAAFVVPLPAVAARTPTVRAAAAAVAMETSMVPRIGSPSENRQCAADSPACARSDRQSARPLRRSRDGGVGRGALPPRARGRGRRRTAACAAARRVGDVPVRRRDPRPPASPAGRRAASARRGSGRLLALPPRRRGRDLERRALARHPAPEAERPAGDRDPPAARALRPRRPAGRTSPPSSGRCSSAWSAPSTPSGRSGACTSAAGATAARTSTSGSSPDRRGCRSSARASRRSGTTSCRRSPRSCGARTSPSSPETLAAGGGRAHV